MIKLYHLILIFTTMAVIHFTALSIGLYQGKVWVDMPLHFMGGIFLGMVWLWIIQKPNYKSRLGMPSQFFWSISVVSFVLFGSFMWELLEFGFWKLFPEIANPLKFYSSSVSDVLSDMFFGILGGIAIALLHKRKLLSYGKSKTQQAV